MFNTVVLLIIVRSLVSLADSVSSLPLLSSLPNATQILNDAAAATSKENSARLFVIGGYNLHQRSEVDAFYLPAGQASKVASLPPPRFAHGAAAVSGLLYTVGGQYDGLTYLETVTVYISSVDTWFEAAPMSIARAALGVCAFENKIYAIGGINNGAVLNTGEVYDATTKRWNPIKAMASKRYRLGVGVLRGQIYAVGGNDGSAYLNSVEKYDPKADQWSAVRAMENHRYDLSVGVVNEKLYAIGGIDDRVGMLKSVDEYDPETNEWSHAADMPAKRYGAGATSFGGLIYVAGGSDGSSYFNTIELFDPKANTWNTSTTMRLSVARDWLAVTML